MLCSKLICIQIIFVACIKDISADSAYYCHDKELISALAPQKKVSEQYHEETKNVSVRVGDDVTFEVPIKPNEHYNVKWFSMPHRYPVWGSTTNHTNASGVYLKIHKFGYEKSYKHYMAELTPERSIHFYVTVYGPPQIYTDETQRPDTPIQFRMSLIEYTIYANPIPKVTSNFEPFQENCNEKKNNTVTDLIVDRNESIVRYKFRSSISGKLTFIATNEYGNVSDTKSIFVNDVKDNFTIRAFTTEETFEMGNAVNITCSVSMEMYKPGFKWYHVSNRFQITENVTDYQIIPGWTCNGYTSTLRIPHLNNSNMGEISCKVLSVHGEYVSKIIKINISDFVHLRHPDDDDDEVFLSDITQYDSILIPCRPSHPNITVSLFHTMFGRKIQMGSKIRFFNNRTFSYDSRIGFILPDADINEGWSFICQFEANNRKQFTTVTIKLVRKFVVKFELCSTTEFPSRCLDSEQLIVPEKQLCLICRGNNKSPLMYYLKYNNQTLVTDASKEVNVSDNSVTLTIDKSTYNDAGLYECVVRNRLMKEIETKSIDLRVMEPPKGYIDYCRQFPKSGHIDMFCKHDGFSCSDITWLKQECDTILDCGNSSWTLFETSDHIAFSLNWNGRIACQLQNNVNSFRNIKKVYLVDVKRGFDIIGGYTQSYVTGDKILLTCLAPKFIYTADVKWYKSLHAVTGHTQVTPNSPNSYNNTYIIENSTLEHSGFYSCRATTLQGELEERGVTVNVKDGQPAEIGQCDLNNSTITKQPGLKDVFFKCQASGYPVPTLTWLKNDKLISPSKELDPNGVHLKIMMLSQEDSGVYKFVAENRYKRVERFMELIVAAENFSDIKTIDESETIKNTKNETPISVIVSLAVIALIMILATLYFVWRIYNERKLRNKQTLVNILSFIEGDPGALNPDMDFGQQTELLPYDTKWEFPRERLKFGKVLGSGEFGLVMEATAFNILDNEEKTKVAVKMVKKCKVNDISCIKALISELKIMAHLGKHLNVVNLLGACTKNIIHREVLVIVEYCQYGCLKDFLSSRRDTFIDQRIKDSNKLDYSIGKEKLQAFASDENHSNRELIPITTHDLLCWAFQVARGMDYLASRKILHGDLALRNIMLSKNDVAKIGDFGLSKNIYINGLYAKISNTPMPIKWMAVESLRDGVFTTQSDVWSYGVVLWELFSLASSPYSDMRMDGSFILNLLNGTRPSKPYHATDFIYRTMLECWALNPIQRPCFKHLACTLSAYLARGVEQNLNKMDEPIQEMNRKAAEEAGYKDYLGQKPPPSYKNQRNEKSSDNTSYYRETTTSNGLDGPIVYTLLKQNDNVVAELVTSEQT